LRQIHTGTSLVRYARAAGVGYLTIIVTGIFAEFAVRTTLRVPGDAAQTAANILGAQLLYRSSLAADFLMLVADVAVALALYVVFRGVSRNLALLAAFFRLTHAAIVGGNLLNVYVPLVLLREGGVRTALGDAQVEALALLHLEAHAYGYAIGLVFFGVYCAILGYLILKSALVPRVLGVLLMVASVGYLTDSFARTLLADYVSYEAVLGMVVLLPAFVAELSFALWLVIKGVRPTEGVE
jgi:hypothetical protein